MVGRRNQKKGRNPKLTKQINANLLKISIKTDNYIYNNEPMTIREAKEMKNELNTYKILAKNGVRSLQIIDKLTRLLQGIITEEENTSKLIAYDIEEGILNVLENIQLNDETVKDKDSHTKSVPNISVPFSDGKVNLERSVDIHFNTSVACSPGTFNPTNTPMIEKSAICNAKDTISISNTTCGLTDPSIINTSGALVNTPALSDNVKTIDTTPETSSLASQDESLVQQKAKRGYTHKTLKKIYKQTYPKRRKNANDLSWIENMKYVRVVEDDEFDPKLSNLGKLWDNFQLPQNWDESDFSFD